MSGGNRELNAPQWDHRPTRPVRDRHTGVWLGVMMFVAFGAVALAVLAIPFVGFGSLLFVFLAICAMMLLVMVQLGRRNRAILDA